MGTVIRAASFEQPPGAGPVSYPGSSQGDWVTVHDNLTATAMSAAVLLRPFTYSSTNVHPVKVPPGAVGFKLRSRCLSDVTTVGTQPKICVYGICGPDPTSAGVFLDDGTNWAERIDSNGDADADGLTLTIQAAVAARTRDSAYSYSDVFPTDGRYDARGNSWVMVLTHTASVVSGGSGTIVALQLHFVN
jgi:hypothetical protein